MGILLGDLEGEPVGKFVGFCKALFMTSQCTHSWIIDLGQSKILQYLPSKVIQWA